MSARTLCSGIAALALLAMPLGAQQTAPKAPRRVTKSAAAPGPSCRVDTTAAWHRAQRAWLNESRGGWTDDALRDALIHGTALDVEQPLAVQLGYELVGAAPVGRADSATTARLRTLASTRGSVWPTRSVVGPAGVRAVWLAATGDTSLAPAVLHRLMEAGPDESLAADVATMEDRQRIRAGRKQLYATQMRIESGRPVPLPTEDLEHVDLRRDGAGLPPVALSECLARRAAP